MTSKLPITAHRKAVAVLGGAILATFAMATFVAADTRIGDTVGDQDRDRIQLQDPVTDPAKDMDRRQGRDRVDVVLGDSEPAVGDQDRDRDRTCEQDGATCVPAQDRDRDRTGAGDAAGGQGDPVREQTREQQDPVREQTREQTREQQEPVREQQQEQAGEPRSGGPASTPDPGGQRGGNGRS